MSASDSKKEIKNTGSFSRMIRTIILLLLGTLVIELFVFNFRYWRSLSYKPIELSTDDIISEDNGESIYANVKDLGIVVKNIGMIFEYININSSVGSEVKSSYNHWLSPEVSFLSCDKEGKIESVGRVFPYSKNSKMHILSTDMSKPVEEIGLSVGNAHFKRVLLNAHEEFEVSPVRVCMLFGVLVMLYFFVFSECFWNMQFLDEKGNINKKTIIFIVLTDIVLFAGISFLFCQNPFAIQVDDIYQFYPQLAHSFAAGHCYDEEKPPAELIEAEDHFNLHKMAKLGIPYKLDRVLYNGRYYTYFGVLPCLLFYLPYYLVTGHDIAMFPVVMILTALFFAAGTLFITELFRRYKEKGSVAEFFFSLLMLMIVTPLTCMANSNTFPYYIPMIMALDLFLLGGYFLLRAVTCIDSGKNGNSLLFAGILCVALIVVSRPNMIFLGFAFVPMLLPYAAIKRNNLKRWGAVLLPLIIVAIPVMLYNYVRFDNPLDFGYSYQLTYTVIVPGHTIMRGISAFRHYLFRLVHFTKEFPYVSFVVTDCFDLEQLSVHEVTGGIFMIFPLLWLSLLSLLPVKITHFEKKSNAMARILVIAAGIVLVVDSLSGDFFSRYRMDFSTAYATAALIVLWNILKRPKKSIRICLFVVLIISIYSSFIQYFSPDMIAPAKKSDFIYRCAETIEFWK